MQRTQHLTTKIIPQYQQQPSPSPVGCLHCEEDRYSATVFPHHYKHACEGLVVKLAMVRCKHVVRDIKHEYHNTKCAFPVIYANKSRCIRTSSVRTNLGGAAGER